MEQFIIDEAIRQGVPPEIALAQWQAESSGGRKMLSPKGAIGDFQLMPQTAKELGVDPYNREQNIKGGIQYYKQQLNRFGSPELALAAYNAGPGNVQKFGGVPPFKETQNYINKVLGASGDNDIFGVKKAMANDDSDIFKDTNPIAPNNKSASVNDDSDIFKDTKQVVANPNLTPKQQEVYDKAMNMAMAGLNVSNQIAMNTKAPQYAAPGVAGKAALVGSGINQVIANTLGLPVDAINSALKGVGINMSDNPVLGSEWIKQNLMPEKINPQGLAENVLASIGEQIGGMAVPGVGLVASGLAKAAPLARILAPAAIRSGVGSGVAREYAPDNPYVDIAAQLAGGVSPKAAVNKLMSIAPNVERDMMIKALKPSSTLRTSEINRLAEDALNLPTSVTERGLNKNMSKVGDIGKVIDERLATVTDEIHPHAIADLAAAKMKALLTSDKEAFPAAKLAQVDQEIEAWKLAHPEPINVSVANELRKSANSEIGPLFQAINKGDTAAIDRMWNTKTKAALSEATAKLISEKVPELKPLLAEQSKRLNLNKTIQNTVNNFKKSDLVSTFDLGAGAGSVFIPELMPIVAARVAYKVLHTPAIRSHLAIGIRRARNATNSPNTFIPPAIQNTSLSSYDAQAKKEYDTRVNKMAGKLKAQNPGINYKEAVRLSKEAIGPME